MTNYARCRSVLVCAAALIAAASGRAHADEIWVAPTYQQDVGGLGVASNGLWPVTAVGAVRLAWAVPNDLQAFQSAKVVLIPAAPGGAANLNVFVCPAQNSNIVTAGCAGPVATAFTGVANTLTEVDISAALASKVGAPGANYLAVVAYTTPTTGTDHIVGLRFAYAPKPPTGSIAGAGNSAFGTGALAINTSGTLNTAVGVSALAANTTGLGNTATGNSALVANQSGSANTASGHGSLASNVSGNFNTATGYSALAHTTTGSNNVAAGYETLASNTSGSDNTAVGVHALASNVTGGANTAVGIRALESSVDAYSNTALGRQALQLNTSGGANMASGTFALLSNQIGSGNTASGVYSLYFNNSGDNNTAVGMAALQGNVAGDYNVGVGYGALGSATGTDNVAIGSYAGTNATTGTGNIYLGARGAAGESNTMYLGQVGYQARAFIAGVRGVTTGVANAVPVMIDSSGQFGTLSSSRRFKEDVRDMSTRAGGCSICGRSCSGTRRVTPTGRSRFSTVWLPRKSPTAFPELAVRGADGNVETVHYETLSVLLLNEMQRQERQNQEQERQIQELRAQVAELLVRVK